MGAQPHLPQGGRGARTTRASFSILERRQGHTEARGLAKNCPPTLDLSAGKPLV